MEPEIPKRVSVQQPLYAAKGRLSGYALAASVLALAVVLRWSLRGVLGDYAPFMFFSPAAMLATWFGGLIPGTLVLVLGLAVGDYAFMPPAWSFGPHHLREFLEIVSYGVTATIGSGLIELLHRSRQKAQRAAEEARLRNTQLEKEIAERKRIQEALEQARNQLTLHSQNLEGLVTDRTARLKETVAALESFCYTVAHDLRAPLRAMEGFGRALLEDYGGALDPTGAGYAERICAASRRLDTLIQSLLEYAKLATIDPVTEDVILEPLLRGVVAQFGPQIKAKAAQVEFVSPFPAVRANVTLLEGALSRLLSNALKFVENGAKPHICIWAKPAPSAVRIVVQDNGIGIAPEFHQKIFGPFGRLHGVDAYPGVGIGLPIFKRAVERMGGKVGVDSEAGKGSQFWIELAPAEGGCREQVSP